MEPLSVNSKHAGLCNNQINLNDYLNLIKEEARIVAAKHPSLDYHELISIGYLALGEAKKRFKPEKQVKFSTYATKYMKGSMLDECRFLEQPVCIPKQRVDDTSFSGFGDTGYEPFSMDAYYDAEEQEWHSEAEVRVMQAKEQLTSEQLFIIDCRIGRFGETMTYAEIGKMLGCSFQNVQQEYKRGIKTLQAELESFASAA